MSSLSGIKQKKIADCEVDTYIKHSKDLDRILVFRIRRKAFGNLLTLKTKSTSEKDVLWKDIDIPFSEPDRLEDILMNSGYEYVVLIDKIRDSFEYGLYEINVDQIRDLGNFVEIEFQSDDAEALKAELPKMKIFLNSIGIADEMIIEKGYVPLMMEKVEQEKR